VSQAPLPWQPREFRRFLRGLNTSMGTARIDTDAGEAYIKAMGNRQGPHPLACEWVATQLARWFGLPTFDTHLIVIDATRDEIPFLRGGRAASGPAFVSRRVSGRPWGGDPADLDSLVNPEAISYLVVFDNWVLNCDRHPPDLATRRPNLDNVFMSDEDTPDGRFRLIAMDHTHCFTCGRDLSPRMAEIDRMRDERFYGLFPEFVPHLRVRPLEEARARLLQAESGMVRGILATIPREWDVSAAATAAWEELICRRARVVAESVAPRLLALCRG
jgi:hypothetical protein